MNRVSKKINVRIIILYFSLVFVAAAIIVKIVFIQKGNQNLEKLSQPKFFDVEAPRGNIYSDDNSLLAISMPLYNVRLDMMVMDDFLFNKHVDDISDGISKIFFDVQNDEIKRKLISAKKNNRRYFLLKNKVTHNELNLLKKLPIFNLGKNKGGLIAEQRPNREKPFGILARRTIGILRESNPVGLERAFDKTLSGIDGIQLKQKIGKNVWVPKDSEFNRMPVAGKDIKTTINIDMQDVAEEALKSSLIQNEASWGCVIIMEVKTGEIKVIANLKRDADTLIDEHYNYSIAEHSEPGSTFKLASIIAGLEDGFFDITDSVDTKNGICKFYNETMKDAKVGGYGVITIGDAFIYSSNVGISKFINKYYKKTPEKFIDRIYKMGLSTPLNLELPYPNNLLIKTPEDNTWSGTTLPWMSIGYEMQLTPLHILSFYNAIANNGKLITPIFTTAIEKQGNIIEERSSKLINTSICSRKTLNKIIPLLEGVVSRGTAKSINTNTYKIAGKTGTTVLNYSKNNKENKAYQTSFAGFFPSEKPKYSGIVVVNNPLGSFKSGGSVAAPLFKEISDKIFASDIDLHKNKKLAYVNTIPPIKNGFSAEIDTILSCLNITTGKVSINRIKKLEEELMHGKVPDLIGMNMKDAIYLLENNGFIVKFSGYGSVIKQSVEKGVTFKKGSLIKLELS